MLYNEEKQMALDNGDCFDQQAFDDRIRRREIRVQQNMNRTSNSFSSSQPSNQPHCPTCGSTNIKKIGTGERAASILGFGLFSRKINKTWKCSNCGHTW